MKNIQITKAEEKVMEIIWTQQKVFLKDIINSYEDPKPAITTVATLLKRLQNKNLVGYKTFGKSREYYAKVEKAQYFNSEMKNFLKTFFNNSASQFASYFTRNAELTDQQLKELRDLIDAELDKKQSDE